MWLVFSLCFSIFFDSRYIRSGPTGRFICKVNNKFDSHPNILKILPEKDNFASSGNLCLQYGNASFNSMAPERQTNVNGIRIVNNNAYLHGIKTNCHGPHTTPAPRRTGAIDNHTQPGFRSCHNRSQRLGQDQVHRLGST